MKERAWLVAVAVAFVVAICGAPGSSLAAKRVALVIGNSAYKYVPELKTPVNDAADIAAALAKLGFEVVNGRNLDEASMRRTIKGFAEALTGAEIGLLFYGGHGLQVNGQNYLVPIDARLQSPAGIDLELIRLDIIHRAMEAEAKANVIFLDASRDNPLSRSLVRAMGVRSAQVGQGLAAVESGVGTLISFSTQPGSVSAEREGRNSPFAAALIKHLNDPTDDLSTLLIEVRNDVMAATGDRQIPWEHSALRSKFYLGAIPGEETLKQRGLSNDQQLELDLWASVKDRSDPAEASRYLVRYPDGVFAALARAIIEQHTQQKRAEEAAREEERQRQEETRLLAEVKRLEEARRAREAAVAEELRQAALAKNDEEARRVETQRRLEEAAIVKALEKAQEEARLAQEAAKKAEANRLEAVKAAKVAKEEAAQKAKSGASAKQQRSCSTVRGECNRVCLTEYPPTNKSQCAPVCSEKYGACLQTGTFVRNRRPTEHNLVRK